MKIRFLNILAGIAAIIFIALLFPSYSFVRNNPVSKANQLKEKAKDEYFAREYLSAYKTYKSLMDSAGAYGDEVMINYANAAFMSSAILKGGMYGRPKGPALSDTILNQIAQESKVMYTVLTTMGKPKIASMAYNQLGYGSIKDNGNTGGDVDADSLLLTALDDFKQALKRDPNNDSARYNYELVKKVLAFPETVLAETKSLVAQKKYIEAANLLEAAMQKDIRLAKQKEFLQRIRSVAGIDTTYNNRRRS